VANILPGDDIRVEITYFQDLAYERGRYEFVFPMVVGPRYIPGAASGLGGTGWSPDTDRVPDASRITPPLLPPGVRPGHDIQVRVDLDAGAPFRELETPSHAIRVERRGPSRAAVSLAPEDTIPNKDFILRWRVDQERPVAGWLAHRDERGGTFLLTLEPEVDPPQSRTAPREYVFVIDTSGSMHGFPLDQAKRVVRRCLEDLGPEDRFQVILFAGAATQLAPSPLDAGERNAQRALRFIDEAVGSGGTEFLPALEKALAAPPDPERARIVLFLSDGYIGYENEVLRYVNEHRADANVFPLGVGSSVNRYLVDAMARAGQGEPFVLTPDEDPEPVVERFFRYVSRPSLTHIRVRFEGVEAEDLEPETLPDLFDGRPLSIVGRYRDGGRARVTLSGRLAGQPWQQTLTVQLPEAETGASGLPLLWARRSIESLRDAAARGDLDREEARERITGRALAYGLMSEYTSFVAVDSQIRNPDGTPRPVAVPVPLPDQVSPLAAPAAAYKSRGGSFPGLFLGRAPVGAVRESLAPVSAPPPPPAVESDPLDADRRPDGGPAGPAEEASAGRAQDPRVEELRIRGTLEEAHVRKVLEEAAAAWAQASCLQGLAGTVHLWLKVDADGRVASVRVREEAPLGEEAAACLREKAQALRFPASAAVSTVRATLSFPGALKSGGSLFYSLACPAQTAHLPRSSREAGVERTQ